MSRWSIHLPHRGDLDAPVVEAAHLARALPQDEDRRVCRQLVLDWAGEVGTIGEALDRLQEMPASERRLLLDGARQAAGLPSIDDVERAERRRHPLALPESAPQPNARIERREDGTLVEVPLTPLRLAYTESGAIIDLDDLEADAARHRAEEQSVQARRRAADEERQRETEARREYEQAKREQLHTELPDHLRETAA